MRFRNSGRVWRREGAFDMERTFGFTIQSRTNIGLAFLDPNSRSDINSIAPDTLHRHRMSFPSSETQQCEASGCRVDLLVAINENADETQCFGCIDQRCQASRRALQSQSAIKMAVAYTVSKDLWLQRPKSRRWRLRRTNDVCWLVRDSASASAEFRDFCSGKTFWAWLVLLSLFPRQRRPRLDYVLICNSCTNA